MARDARVAVAVSATYNYLHAALNLARSIRDTWTIPPKVYIGLADQPERERPGFEAMKDVEIVPATALDAPDLWWHAAKLGPGELCCFLKPYLVRHVLARGHDTVVYCDADVQFFDDAQSLVEHAPQANLVLVPHMTSPIPRDAPDVRPTTGDIALVGTMNAGLFLARRRPATLAFLERWMELGTAPGYFLPEYGQTTDQQALNWAFAYLDDVAVFRDRRFNIAYWNLHERPLRWSHLDGGREDEWTLDGRPIVCFHFSGLAWGERRLSVHDARHALSLNINLWALCEHYHRRLLDAHAAHYATAGYEYGEVDGRPLPPEIRAELGHFECVGTPAGASWSDVPAALRQTTRTLGRTSVLPLYLERILQKRLDLVMLDGAENVCRLGFLKWVDRWLLDQHPCALLHEYYTEAAFSRPHLDMLATQIARGPLGLSPDEVREALLTDRPALLRRLRAHDAGPHLLEMVESASYRHPAFEPALCIRTIYESRPDLKDAYPDPLGWSLPGFQHWLRVSLPSEYVLPERVRELSTRLDPLASLARVLGYAQRFDPMRRELMAGGLRSWTLPHLVGMLPHAQGFDAADVVVLAWWLEQHAETAQAVIDRALVPSLALPRAAAYLEWWCRRNLAALRGVGALPERDLPTQCAEELRDFVAALPTKLAAAEKNGDLLERFVAGCDAARLELRRPRARDLLTEALAPDPRGVNVFGHFRSPIGLGMAATGVAAALDRAGYHARRIVLSNATMDPDLAPEDLYPDFGFGCPRNLIVTYPHIQHDNFEVFPPEFFEGRETSAYVAWEQRDLHPLWAERLRRYDRLFALSRFAADAISAGTGRPCTPVPCVVDVDHAAVARWPRASFGIPEDRFVAGLVFDATSSVERKNPLAAVRAIGRGLAGRNALLVVKMSGGEHARFAPEIRALADEARRLGLDHLLITERMPRDRVHALIACFDVYLSLHRSEGFGYTIAEAMRLDVPVVATAYSGNMDFMTPENSYPVAWREVIVDRQEGPFQLGTVWAEPDQDDAIAQCRRVYDARDEARARAARARRDIEACASVDAVARRLQAVFG